jgi:hypothetical protein
MGIRLGRPPWAALSGSFLILKKCTVPHTARIFYFPDWKGSQSKPQISLCSGIL